MRKSEKMEFLESFVDGDHTAGRYRQLIDLMNLCGYLRSRSRSFLEHWSKVIYTYISQNPLGQ